MHSLFLPLHKQYHVHDVSKVSTFIPLFLFHLTLLASLFLETFTPDVFPLWANDPNLNALSLSHSLTFMNHYCISELACSSSMEVVEFQPVFWMSSKQAEAESDNYSTLHIQCAMQMKEKKKTKIQFLFPWEEKNGKKNKKRSLWRCFAFFFSTICFSHLLLSHHIPVSTNQTKRNHSFC